VLARLRTSARQSVPGVDRKLQVYRLISLEAEARVPRIMRHLVSTHLHIPARWLIPENGPKLQLCRRISPGPEVVPWIPRRTVRL